MMDLSAVLDILQSPGGKVMPVQDNDRGNDRGVDDFLLLIPALLLSAASSSAPASVAEPRIDDSLNSDASATSENTTGNLHAAPNVWFDPEHFFASETETAEKNLDAVEEEASGAEDSNAVLLQLPCEPEPLEDKAAVADNTAPVLSLPHMSRLDRSAGDSDSQTRFSSAESTKSSLPVANHIERANVAATLTSLPASEPPETSYTLSQAEPDGGMAREPHRYQADADNLPQVTNVTNTANLVNVSTMTSVGGDNAMPMLSDHAIELSESMLSVTPGAPLEHPHPATQMSPSHNVVRPFELPQHIQHKGWGDHFNQQIVWLGQQKIQSAVLRLNPKDVGPLEVSIKMLEKGASLHINTHSPQVQELIEQSLPRLREMLLSQGVQLDQVNIEQRNPQSRQNSPMPAYQQTAEAAVEEAAAAAEELRTVSSGLVDYFA
ncbi:MAG: flagellar hook-length control protein FliK [Legionellaceae bacterium]|nr:flagellar hook-length control protein FliK [Legionellaceae bacterium]